MRKIVQHLLLYVFQLRGIVSVWMFFVSCSNFVYDEICAWYATLQTHIAQQFTSIVYAASL